jgi:16S rRNA (uracil1498-N3)-methyltransferase
MSPRAASAQYRTHHLIGRIHVKLDVDPANRRAIARPQPALRHSSSASHGPMPAMLPRFFLTHAIADGRARLDGPEGHHLIHVLRAKSGTQIALFDGRGTEFEAVVETVGRSSVELRIEASRKIDRESLRTITLAVSLPKGERQRWLVEKAVELGVARLVPLVTERSVAEAGRSAIARIERAVIEASKQCGRNCLMQIAPQTPWADFVAAPPLRATRLVAHPGGMSLGEWLASHVDRAPDALESIVLAVGPEGGLTDHEIVLAANAGWQLVDLGPRILRIETAALALVAAVLYSDK